VTECSRCGGGKGPKFQRVDYCGKCKPAVLRERRDRAHRRRVEAQYNLPEGGYDALYEAQGGKCAMCRWATGKTKRLAVDHDHSCCPAGGSCGKCVRGLLCGTCNKIIGHARDDAEYFERGASYLRNPPAREVLSR